MGGRRKQFLDLAGEPVLRRALRPFLAQEGVVSIVVALPRDVAEDPPPWLSGLDPRIRVVAGGATRSASVARAVEALPEELDVVVVHDGARPLVSRETIERCIAVAATGRGAVAGWPAVDTLKEVDGEGRVVETPDRSRYWHAQTPQAFPRDVLTEVYRKARAEGIEATDDAALVERYGVEVVMVEGSPRNIKVTRAEDLELARLFLELDGGW